MSNQKSIDAELGRRFVWVVDDPIAPERVIIELAMGISIFIGDHALTQAIFWSCALHTSILVRHSAPRQPQHTRKFPFSSLSLAFLFFSFPLFLQLWRSFFLKRTDNLISYLFTSNKRYEWQNSNAEPHCNKHNMLKIPFGFFSIRSIIKK